jgi:predicted NBD/HSP70 family sugar kinase
LGVCLTNLKSEIIDAVFRDTRDFTDGLAAVEWACSSIEKLMDRNAVPLSRLAGIGSAARGRWITAGALFWIRLTLRSSAISRSCPWFRENSTSGASGKQRRAACDHGILLRTHEEYKNSMFVIISNGIGSCLMIDGRYFADTPAFGGAWAYKHRQRRGGMLLRQSRVPRAVRYDGGAEKTIWF